MVVSTLVAGIIRVGVAVTDPLWLDELHTSWCCTADSLAIAIDRAAQGNQTPFYFWLDYQLVQAAGLSEFSLRLISVLSGIALVGIAAGWVARTTNSLMAGALTGLVASVEPGLVFHATEARPFGLLQLVGLIQFISFLCVWQNAIDPVEPRNESSRPASHHRQQTARLSLLIGSALIPWIHLTGAILLFAQFIWCILWIRNRGAVACLKLLSVAALTAIPLYSLARSIGDRRGDWSIVADPYGLATEWGTLLLIWAGLPAVGWLVSRFTQGQPRSMSGGTSAYTLATLIWCIIFPPAALIVADIVFDLPIALSRYAQVVAGLVPILAGWIVSRIDHDAARKWAAVFTLLVTLWWSPIVDSLATQGRLPRMRHEDWKNAVERLNQQAEPHDPLFLFSNLVEDHRVTDINSRPKTAEDQKFLEYLRFPVRGIYRAVNDDVRPRSTLVPPRFESVDLDAVAVASQGWMLIRGTPDLVTAICEDFRMKSHQEFGLDAFSISAEQLPGSNVFLVQVRYEPPIVTAD